MTRAPWAPPPTRRDTWRRIGGHLLTGVAAVAELVTPPPPAHRVAGRHAERGQVYGQPVRARRKHAYLRLSALIFVMVLGGYAVACAAQLLTD